MDLQGEIAQLMAGSRTRARMPRPVLAVAVLAAGLMAVAAVVL